MIVLSVDQAKTTGWAIFDNEELIDYGCIRSKFNNYCDVSFHVCTHINALIDKYNPDIVLFEDVANQSNSLTHKNLSMLLGFLVCSCLYRQKDYRIIHSSSWRKILRDNIEQPRAKSVRLQRKELKDMSKKYVNVRCGVEVSDDIADAINMGLYYLEYRVNKNE